MCDFCEAPDKVGEEYWYKELLHYKGVSIRLVYKKGWHIAYKNLDDEPILIPMLTCPKCLRLLDYDWHYNGSKVLFVQKCVALIKSKEECKVIFYVSAPNAYIGIVYSLPDASYDIFININKRECSFAVQEEICEGNEVWITNKLEELCRELNQL